MERFDELSSVQWSVLFSALSSYVLRCQANENMTKAMGANGKAKDWRQWKIVASELSRELRS